MPLIDTAAPPTSITESASNTPSVTKTGASVLCKKLPIPCVPETGDHWIH